MAHPQRRGSIEPTDDTVMMANCEGDYRDWVEWLVAEATVENVAGWWDAVKDLILRRDAWLLSAPQQALRAAVAAGDLAALATAVRCGADAVSCIGAAHLAACAKSEAVISLLQHGCAVDALLPAAPWSRLTLCSPQLATPGPAGDGAASPFDALGGRDAALRHVESALAGASPLHCAALCGHAANVHLLLAAGARPERCNARGDTAADLAMMFEPLHTPDATGEILAALAATSHSHCVVVYSHVCMKMQAASRVRRRPSAPTPLFDPPTSPSPRPSPPPRPHVRRSLPLEHCCRPSPRHCLCQAAEAKEAMRRQKSAHADGLSSESHPLDAEDSKSRAPGSPRRVLSAITRLRAPLLHRTSDARARAWRLRASVEPTGPSISESDDQGQRQVLNSDIAETSIPEDSVSVPEAQQMRQMMNEALAVEREPSGTNGVPPSR